MLEPPRGVGVAPLAVLAVVHGGSLGVGGVQRVVLSLVPLENLEMEQAVSRMK